VGTGGKVRECEEMKESFSGAGEDWKKQKRFPALEKEGERKRKKIAVL